MKAALSAVYWEILWKNRVVFPAQLGLLGLGAALTWIATQTAGGNSIAGQLRMVALMTFLVSILLGFAPFTLMESSGGWRMNSMVTRWFALPLRTAHLVFLPLATACVFLALLVLTWVPVLHRIAPGFDALFFIAILVVGQVAVSTLAWLVPRKPAQFWIGTAVLFPVLLVLSLGVQDHPGREQAKLGLLVPLSFVTVLMLAVMWAAASLNRCGAWPGELPLDRIWDRVRGGRGRPAAGGPWSPLSALIRVESLATLRILGFSWASLIAVLFLGASLEMKYRHQALAFSLRLVILVSVGLLPVLGVLWMAIWGLFAAGEPSAMFQSRLSSFRATLPISCGLMAGQRILLLFVGWALIWLPLVGISFLYRSELVGMPLENMAMMQAAMARHMAVGAFVLAGALPLYLWGRLEGLPNFLLAALCIWGTSWLITSLLTMGPDEEPGRQWGIMVTLLLLKVIVATTGIALAWGRGHISWKFPAMLVGGWVAAAGLLILAMPVWQTAGAWPAAMIALLLPLGRLTWCPLAIAANRHRR